MNLDFILFSGPKVKYKFIDLWGQAIFIPSYSPSPKQQKINKNILSELTTCYKSKKSSDVYFSIQNALSDVQGANMFSESQGTTISNNQLQLQDLEYITHYIPCLYLDSMVKSKYIIIYFHASGEDIKIAHGFLNFIRNSYQVNVLAMEYSGYSIYQGSVNSQVVNRDARTVYQYVNTKLGFAEQNIIVIGRSIGTGVALDLLKNPSDKECMNVKKRRKLLPRALALISPFASVKNLAKQFIGKLGLYLAKESYNNQEYIQDVQCPVFVVHGKKDALISTENSKQILNKCKTKKTLITPEDMTHSAFDYYTDLVDPLREFLLQQGINFYQQNMEGPKIPQQLFHCPQDFPI